MSRHRIDGYDYDVSDDTEVILDRLDRVAVALERLATAWEKHVTLSEVALSEHDAPYHPRKDQVA